MLKKNWDLARLCHGEGSDFTYQRNVLNLTGVNGSQNLSGNDLVRVLFVETLELNSFKFCHEVI